MELGYLLFAYLIVLGALLQVQLGVMGTFDFQLIAVFGVLVALTLGMHTLLRFRAPQADPFLLPLATTLNGLGISMIYRLDLVNSDISEGSIPNATAQIVYTGLGIGVGIAVLIALRNHRLLQRYTYIFGAVSLVLLLLPLVPLSLIHISEPTRPY